MTRVPANGSPNFKDVVQQLDHPDAAGDVPLHRVIRRLQGHVDEFRRGGCINFRLSSGCVATAVIVVVPRRPPTPSGVLEPCTVCVFWKGGSNQPPGPRCRARTRRAGTPRPPESREGAKHTRAPLGLPSVVLPRRSPCHIFVPVCLEVVRHVVVAASGLSQVCKRRLECSRSPV